MYKLSEVGQTGDSFQIYDIVMLLVLYAVDDWKTLCFLYIILLPLSICVSTPLLIFSKIQLFDE